MHNFQSDQAVPDYQAPVPETPTPTAPSRADATPAEPVETRPDTVPTSVPAPDDTPRQLFTLTVEDVAVKLAEYDIYRDPRTIQRWCKSGKLKALLDERNGDRYLIEPTSLNDMVATLLEERERQTQARQSVSPTRRDTAATSLEPEPQVSRPDAEAVVKSDDNKTDTAATSEERRDRSDDTPRRIAELERENAMLRADKQVREQMVEYMQGKFDEMLATALDRTQRLGQLEAENDYLRKALPPVEQGSLGFHPRNVQTPFTTDERDEPARGV